MVKKKHVMLLAGVSKFQPGGMYLQSLHWSIRDLEGATHFSSHIYLSNAKKVLSNFSSHDSYKHPEV